jgi:pimeloyl-ACP methyl ester carboxylesterase
VLASVAFDKTGLHPHLFQASGPHDPTEPTQEDLQRRFRREYEQLAPDPDAWTTLLAKVAAIDLPELSGQALSTIDVPILLIVGDSDIVTPEHAVATFRLLGGGVLGDLTTMPASQLAILPGTSHLGICQRADTLMTIIPPFLDTR